MKKFALVIVSLFLINWGQAQELIGKLSSKRTLGEFQAVAFNDSVLISYKESPKTASSRNVTKWLRLNGTLRNESYLGDVFDIRKFDDGVYYYFFAEEKKRPVLKALIEKVGMEREEFSSYIEIGDKVIGSYFENNLFVLSFNEDTNQIRVKEINGMKVVNERKYVLPIPFSKYLKKEFQIFNGQSVLNAFMGWAKVKFYLYKDLYITVDEPYSSDAGKKQIVQTRVFILKSGSEVVETFNFPELSRDKFCSFVTGTKLFRTTISKKKFSLNVYDLQSQKLISQREILEGQESFNAYYRHGQENIVLHNQPMSLVMKGAWGGIPSLVVFNDSVTHVVQWGTYFDEKGVIGVSPTNIIGLLVMVVGTTAKQLGDGPGISEYFYNEWNSSSGEFILNKDPGNARNKIDQYEIDMALKGVKYKYKTYVPFQEGVLALYFDDKKDEAIFVKFN